MVKVLVGLVSLVVFGGTCLGWAQVHQLVTGLSTADVIDPGAQTGTAGEQNILLVGLDTRTDAQGNPLPQSILNQLHAGSGSDGGDNTDTMIVIHIPAGGKGAVAFSIPRDSYVQLAGGYGMHKINSAYTYAQVAATNRLSAKGVSGAQLNLQAAQAGAKNAIQTVEQFTGLTINHFASVNLVGFYDISQAVGGVPVCLNNAVNDPYSGARFPAGPQTISGAQALAFVRQRHGLPGGDLDRIRRQQAFMASMAHTVLSAGTLTDTTKLSALTDAIKKTVTLDQGWDVLSFAQQLGSLSAGNIRFETIPVISVSYQTSDGDSVEVNPAQIRSFIAQAIGGPAPAAASRFAVPTGAVPTGAVPIADVPGADRVTIDVDNGSAVAGLAARVLQDLTDQGYHAGTVGTVASRRSTVVDYATGQRAEAEKVAQFLGGDVTVSADPGLRSGHLRILLGTGYSGPDSQPADVTTPSPSTSNAPPPITAGNQNCVN